MNFKEWLIKNEVAKARPKNVDISNLAIGRIGPMGTYGQDDIPSVPAWATASALGAIGKSMRQELGTLGSDAAARLLPLASIKEVHKEGMELPLQIPFIDGKELFSIARSSEKLVLSKILASIKDPLKNPNIRRQNEVNPNMPGKFELVDQSDKDQGKVQMAKMFTEGLIKVIIIYKMMNMKTATGTPLSNIYDVLNPKVSSRYFRNNHLGVILNYTKLKNVQDEENDYTEMDPENNNIIKSLMSGEEIRLTSEEISSLKFRLAGNGVAISELPELSGAKFNYNNANGFHYIKLLRGE